MKKLIALLVALFAAPVWSATATGDFAIDFSALGNADPYTDANLTLIDTGYNVRIASAVLRPSNGGSGQFDIRRLRYNGAITGGATLRSKIEVGTAANGDELLAIIIDASGQGYGLRVNQTSVALVSYNSAGSGSGLISGTAASASSGDVFTLELNQATHQLTAYLNGVAITGTGEGGLLSVIDSTYTSDLAPGLGFNAQNSSASTMRSWAADGIAGASPATLSSPTPSGTLGTQNTATIGATTDQTSGTFYAVVDTAGNISGITASQVKAGQNNASAAAVDDCNASVSTSSPSCGVSGLTDSTAYSYAAVQNNANGDSNVVTGTFTTAAPGGGSAAVPVFMHHYQQMRQP